MATHALTLANPGGETGNTTGWTSRSGGVPGVLTSPGSGSPHSGTYAFVGTASGATAKWDQQVDVSAYAAAIDAGTATIKFTGWHIGFSGDTDSGALYVEAYASDGTTLLGSKTNSASDPGTWTQEFCYFSLPANTRFVRVGTTNTRVTGTELSTYWDDFALEIADATADYQKLKWRISCTATQNAGSWISISEVEMRAAIGGADQCNGGTATSSGTGGGNGPTNAFDNSTGTKWQSGAAAPGWLQYEFTSPTNVLEVAITATPTAGDSPMDFTIEYFDGATWQTAKTVVGVLWNASQQKTFPIGSVKTSADSDSWRVYITAVQTPGSFASIAEVDMHATIGGADQCSGGTAYASSVNPTTSTIAQGFDNNNANKWQAANGALPQWLGYAFPGAADINELALTAPSTNVGDTPTALKLQYHDGEQWRDKYSIVTPSTWTASEQRVFSSSNAPTGGRRRQLINC